MISERSDIMSYQRASGVLMHISSLPGEYSIGSLGREAYRFVDFLAESGFTYWQTLPVCMTDECNSPYKSPSLFSVNPFFIDLPTLHESGLITDSELADAKQRSPYLAEYDVLRENRLELLSLASKRVSDRSRVYEFIRKHPEYDVTARYLALRDTYGEPWRAWQRNAVPCEERLFLWQFIAYEFVREWNALRKYAGKKGVILIGDRSE